MSHLFTAKSNSSQKLIESHSMNDWKWVRLGDVCDVIMGQSPPSSTYNSIGKGLPFFQGKSEFTELYPVVEKWCDAPNKIAEKNDILLSVRAPVGATNIADQKCCIGRGLAAIRFKNFKYAFYFLSSIEQQLDQKGTGTTFRSISGETIRDTLFPLVGNELQDKIVNKIEELLFELDKGKQQLETARQKLKIYRQAVLKSAYEGKLTNSYVSASELPDGWRWVKSGELFSYVTSGSRGWAKHYSDKGSIFIRITNMDFDSLELDLTESNIQYVDLPTNSEGIRTKVQEGDFLFSITGYLGMFAIAPKLDNAYVNQHVCLCRPKEGFNKKYVGYWIISKSGGHHYLNLNQKGAVKAGLNLDDLKTFPIPLASIEEQDSIVQEIESRLSVCDKVEETIVTSLKQAEILRQSILKNVFEGKLVSQTEIENINSLVVSLPNQILLEKKSESKVVVKKKAKQIQFPKVIEGISTTDLHAGVLAMVIEAHEKSPKYTMKLSHVKGEKIAHLVESFVGIELGRIPKKDAAGPDDFPHLKKVESRAMKANWFGVKRLKVGQTYFSKSGMPRIIEKVKNTIPKSDLDGIDKLIKTFLPFDLEHAEVIATVYAGWNNLLIEGKSPTDEEIVYESRENWSKRKLGIERESFFKALKWMRDHDYTPKGTGKKVS